MRFYNNLQNQIPNLRVAGSIPAGITNTLSRLSVWHHSRLLVQFKIRSD